MKSVRKRLTYANVMSSIAVFLVLGGATAFAATKIGTSEIKAGAITSGKIAKEAVGTAKIKNGAVNTSKIGAGAVGAAQINTTGLVAPNATHAATADKADSATRATTADSATRATTADSATTASSATNATNATNLGGLPASAYQPRTQWAVVKSDGTILSQSGGITMFKHNVNGGNYIDFGQSIVGKAITTSIRYLDPNIGSETANVTAQPCSGPTVTFPCLEAVNDPEMAFVHTSDDEGNNAVFGFTILVTP